MTVAPITGTDVNSYIADTAGNKASTSIVQVVNADGTPFTGGGSGSSANQVQGNAASGATDTGNPVKVGGLANSTPSTVTAGQRVDGWLSLNGAWMIGGQALTGSDAVSNAGLAGLPSAGSTASRPIGAAGFVFNGSSWDRMRGDTAGVYMVLRGSASLTANQATAGTSAAQIVAARTGRSRVTITNLGTTDVFIGPTGVTTTTGQLLVGTKGASITLNTSAAIFAIVGTGTQAVSFIEEY